MLIRQDSNTENIVNFQITHQKSTFCIVKIKESLKKYNILLKEITEYIFTAELGTSFQDE